jgi:hypothetical protein
MLRSFPAAHERGIPWHRDGRLVAHLHPVDGQPAPFVVIHRMVSGIDSFPLLAVPSSSLPAT